MKIGITGQEGRVGTLLVNELKSGNFAGVEYIGGTTLVSGDEEIANIFQQADVIIDFTAPTASMNHARLAAAHGTAMVIGTSGLSEENEAELKELSKHIPIILAANTSVGVNLLIALVEEAAKRLNNAWDAEILDVHHKHKVDAPSGTSYALARAIEKGRNESAKLTLSREGHTGAREQGSIGFSVQRGGDVIAENAAIFFGEGERLEITHRAQDRSIFAKGAIKAALWLESKEPGFYAMRDVLGI